MNRLVEIRSQESLCRERAALDFERGSSGSRKPRNGNSARLMKSPITFASAMSLTQSLRRADVCRAPETY